MSELTRQFDLRDKVALITGGSKGLGKAMARGLAEAGADIVICSRNETELRSAAPEIRSGLERRVEWIATDMNNRAAVDALAEESLKRMGRVDILINNAGSNVPQPIDEVTDDAWDRIIE